MTGVGSDQLCDQVDGLRQMAASALSSASTDQFERFEKQLNALETMLREVQQEMWAAEAKTAIQHLEAGVPLSETDQQVIRTFLVSDAEHYLAVENNYREWLEELQRLMDDIGDRVQNVDRESIGELRGVLKDAIRLVPDIRNHLDETQRVERFNTALHSFDEMSRTTLARVLREQLERPNR